MRCTLRQPETAEEFEHYYHLRWKLLRAPWDQPEGSEVDDIEERCFHVMAVDDKNTVIAVARLQFNSGDEAQIRYMAVEQLYEKQGIGRRLVNALEEHARTCNYKKIILDAREPAIGFYQKLGFKLIGKSYLLFDEIQHFRMAKDIKRQNLK